MGNNLPEPQETQARNTIKVLAPDVVAWIAHHLRNSLMPLVLISHKLEYDISISDTQKQLFVKALKHLTDDVDFLVGDRKEPAK